MLTIIIGAIVVILLTIGIVKAIDKFLPSKFKPVIMIVLWALIVYLGYITFMSVYGEIKFNKLKEKRYAQVITNLIDIRDAELAHRTVTGKFQGNWDDLIKFIDTAQFTITQRRDSTVIDKEATRRFGGVETTKEIIIIDTLGYVPVKDSLFGADPRYKTMMNIPVGKPGEKFELQAGFLEQNGFQIPVFEAKALKSIILYGEDLNLIAKENQAQSVEAVNGDALRVGSMEEVNTNGNWPKNYSNKQ
ncbi:MAG: hypothetical protein L3J25_07850 [Flavobacteriaceae bacterium]|nr:hypothetical protein [Flavobacteriaceae bacterium]